MDPDGKEADGARAEIPPNLLHPTPLDHTNPFLSPAASPGFHVDDFLLSRAPGSTLNQIATDLQDYSVSLKAQLNIVVDRDFKGFVNLGTALKAEGPRIARLDWKVATAPSTSRASLDGQQQQKAVAVNQREGDEEWNEKFETPKGSGGNLGLDKVRSEVVSVRDRLRKAEEDVRRVMRSKEAAEVQKANLMMLLSLNDSLRRLETLLLDPADRQEGEEGSSDEEEEGADDQSSKYWQAFSKFSEYDHSDSNSEPSEVDEVSDAKHKQSTSRTRRSSSKSQRRSSGLLAARRRSSHKSSEVVEDAASTAATSSLHLPTRIARASSEHAALVFLRNRAVAIGFTAFVAAHQERAIRVRELLKSDLKKLIRVLTMYQGSSLLLGADTKGRDDIYSKVEREELGKWSLNANTTQERKAEQVAWFESALATWCELPATESEPDGQTNGAKEAEETIRASMMSSWARETITADALTRRRPDPRTPKTPYTFGQDSRFASLQETEEAEEEEQADGYLLSPNLVDGLADDSQAEKLVHLYNDILIFVATRTKLVSQAAERVIARGGQESTANRSHCDVFVHVVWDVIATRLMEQLGGQLFFAGRPEVFHRNYTISMAFLAAFESLSPSDRAGQALKQSSVHQTFRKRWQLPVYFQIRLRDTITRLEQALASSSGPHFASVTSAADQQLPLMAATAETLISFESPWQRGTHILELANRQWKLSLQVLNRYQNWIEEELPTDIINSSRRMLDSAKVSSTRSSNDIARTGSPSRVGTPTVSDMEGDDALLSTCTVVAADLVWLEEETMRTFDDVIAASLRGRESSNVLIQSLRQTLQGSQSMQVKILPLLASRVTSILKSRCAEPLRLVRSVSTQYRIQPSSSGGSSSTGGQGDSSEPSLFVVQFLRPVRHFLGKGDGKLEPRRVEVMSRLLNRRVRSQWISEVVEDFVARYAASLRTMNKNYESLRRLKRGNAATSASSMGFGGIFNRNSGAGAANSSKGEEEVEAKRMHSQMMVDVECLEREVQDLVNVETDVQTDTLAWKRLKEAARGEQDE